MEKERLCEASRAPNCSSIVINETTLQKESVSEHMGWVRNVVLMSVYLGLEKPQGVGIPGGGGQMGR
jgi:hypothetical protein